MQDASINKGLKTDMSIKKNTDANFHFLFFFFVKETGDGKKTSMQLLSSSRYSPPACSENIRRFDINHLFSEQLLEVKNKLPMIKK